MTPNPQRSNSWCWFGRGASLHAWGCLAGGPAASPPCPPSAPKINEVCPVQHGRDAQHRYAAAPGAKYLWDTIIVERGFSV
eukprot:365042-Chlamydomonas_euryale.AAC.24